MYNVNMIKSTCALIMYTAIAFVVYPLGILNRKMCCIMQIPRDIYVYGTIHTYIIYQLDKIYFRILKLEHRDI